MFAENQCNIICNKWKQFDVETEKKITWEYYPAFFILERFHL